MVEHNEYMPQTVTPPAVTLQEKLDELGMSAQELAQRLSLSEVLIMDVLNGDHPITQEIAAQLEELLVIPASFWLNRQRHYMQSLRHVKRRKQFKAVAKAC